MSLKALTVILGHATAEVTLDVYADASDEFKIAEMRRIEEEAVKRKHGITAENSNPKEHETPYDHLYHQNTTNAPESMASCGSL